MMKVILMICMSLFSQLVWAGNLSQYQAYNMNGQQSNMPVKRDPFTTSNKMHQEMVRQSGMQSGNASGFMPGYGVGTIPKMHLKGFVTKNRNKATALLDIEGAGVYMVSKGDHISLHAMGMNAALEVVDIDANGVKVRSGIINQVIVVR